MGLNVILLCMLYHVKTHMLYYIILKANWWLLECKIAYRVIRFHFSNVRYRANLLNRCWKWGLVMRCRTWASNTEMPVLHPTAGCLRKQGLHNHQPLLCHSSPNNTWMCWPILSLELQNNSYWTSLSAEESKGKLILTIWVTKLFGLG